MSTSTAVEVLAGPPSLAELESAAKTVYKAMPPTPQRSWPLINKRAGTEVWVKHENHTPIGAFKVRGGLVYADWLRREHPDVKGIISATRGNHGQSLAFAARQFGLKAVLVVPHGNSKEKNAAMRGFGAELVEHGEDFHAADHHSDELARERGLHKVDAFNWLLVHGVGTYGLELFRGAPELDAVYVPIGWGSGISGVASARNALNLKTKVIGVVSAQAPSFALSLAAGKSVEQQSRTRIADGMAISHPHEDSLRWLRTQLERVVQVTDDEVEEAMRIYFTDTHNVAEGAGASSLAALLQEKEKMAGKRVAVIVSGGNVDRDVYLRVLGKS